MKTITPNEGKISATMLAAEIGISWERGFKPSRVYFVRERIITCTRDRTRGRPPLIGPVHPHEKLVGWSSLKRGSPIETENGTVECCRRIFYLCPSDPRTPGYFSRDRHPATDFTATPADAVDVASIKPGVLGTREET